MKILFVSRWYPYPVDNGSKIRIFNLIRTLANHHDIDLISFSGERVSGHQIEMMNRYCQGIRTCEYRVNDKEQISILSGLLSPRPMSTVVSHNPEMQAFISEAERNQKYDLVISSQLDMAAYTSHWRTSPLLFEEMELTSLYEKYKLEKKRLTRWRRMLMWQKYKYYIKDFLKAYQCCTVVSELERLRVKEIVPTYDRVEVIPNGVDNEHLQGDYGEVEPDSLIYTGALSYDANLDAMEYFLQDIFPLIKRKSPNTKVYITGSTKGIDLKWLPSVDGVVFTGYLKDVRPRIAKSCVSIVPLRIGGGTRLKILEALALKTPVVSTRKGVEGLDLTAGEDLLVGDTPEEFAESVLRMLKSESLRQKLSQQGNESVRRKYDWEIIGEKLNKVLQSMV
jgi:polysaccharide biosynthesis protein PslH